MVMLQPDFMYGVVRRTLLLGVLAALIILFTVSVEVAEAVVVGTLVSATNLRVVTASIKKMFDRGREGKASATIWTLVLVAKMLLLVALIWVLITRVELNAVGFVFGFSIFLPAIFWQLLVSGPDDSEDDFSETE